jgi:hypothetical protein
MEGKKIILILYLNVVERVVIFQDVGQSQVFLKDAKTFRCPFRVENTCAAKCLYQKPSLSLLA